MTTADIAREWRSQVISPLVWKPCPNQAGAVQGEAGGEFVSADGFARRAYMKPKGSHGDEAIHARAAREKVASDIAYDLSFPVPPAVLTERNPLPAGYEKAVVVSLIMYPTQFAWEHVRRTPLDDSVLGLALRKVCSDCSAMFVFDTWLDQTDHADHPHNIVWGYDPNNRADSKIVFLDYANSMGFGGGWAGGGWSRIQSAPFPPMLLANLDKEKLRAAIKAIEDYPDASINEIVGRIPISHISDNRVKDAIAAGLIGRKSLVRQALAQYVV